MVLVLVTPSLSQNGKKLEIDRKDSEDFTIVSVGHAKNWKQTIYFEITTRFYEIYRGHTSSGLACTVLDSLDPQELNLKGAKLSGRDQVGC